MAQLKITQTRGLVHTTPVQRATIAALGLHRIRHTVVHEKTPAIEGMVRVVSHMVKVEEI
ncbi:MAG: 50S ribosomal protein L30 [Fibrobacterales bacterium]|jgi:large subunit ribosomal protein L30|nr:50S ribosomal protein L30 [Fibrobacterales bacterium]MBP5351982.1 50S ribosomal protein L30 [Fibrobacterales bacterium]